MSEFQGELKKLSRFISLAESKEHQKFMKIYAQSWRPQLLDDNRLAVLEPFLWKYII